MSDPTIVCPSCFHPQSPSAGVTCLNCGQLLTARAREEAKKKNKIAMFLRAGLLGLLVVALVAGIALGVQHLHNYGVVDASASSSAAAAPLITTAQGYAECEQKAANASFTVDSDGACHVWDTNTSQWLQK
jgi:hypothetical protein